MIDPRENLLMDVLFEFICAKGIEYTVRIGFMADWEQNKEWYLDTAISGGGAMFGEFFHHKLWCRDTISGDERAMRELERFASMCIPGDFRMYNGDTLVYHVFLYLQGEWARRCPDSLKRNLLVNFNKGILMYGN
jgi:hypothetical protein